MGTLEINGGSIDKNEASSDGGGVENSGTDAFTMTDGTISANKAKIGGGVANFGNFDMTGGVITENSVTGSKNDKNGIGGGVANAGTFVMSDNAEIYGNTAKMAANDFYNGQADGSDGGFNIGIDDSWDNNHDMGIESLSEPAPRAENGTFTLRPAKDFYYSGWFEDELDNRYTPDNKTQEYTVTPNDKTRQYLTLGEPLPPVDLTITPVDMTAYTGGDSIDNDSFPTARYKIEAEDGVDLSQVEFTVGGVEKELPEGTQTGDIVVLDWLNDTFTLDESGSMTRSARNGGDAPDDAAAGIYTIEAEKDGITASVGGAPVTLNWGTGKLTVRNVSDPEGVLDNENPVDIAQQVVSDASEVNTDNGIGVAVIPAETKYYTNGKPELNVKGIGTPTISLLFDNLLPGEQGQDTTQLLIDHANVKGYDFNKQDSQFKYLDLINENDGNAWVSTDDGANIQIYWPIPAGVNASECNFYVLHFTGLHREYRGDLENQINGSVIEKLDAKVDGKNVVFELTGNQASGSFSPFALVWEAKDDGNNSGGGTTYYTLHYDSNGGTQYDNERYRRNTVVELDKTPLREGYTFTGWYADEELTERITEIKMTSNKTVYAGWEATDIPDWLNGDDHFAYIVGRNDGLVHPEADITRAEAATMFFRLLDDEVRQKNLAETNSFTDTPKDAWYNTTVSTMAKLGIVTGDPDGSFRPDDSITRAEFAAIAVRFDDSAYDGEELFTDIAGHWAQNEINAAANKGWISGYADGTFRPQKDITRAEAVTLVNRVLNRLPENTDDLLDTMKVWPDNQPEDWYYLAVQEATNSHDFERKGDGVHERWTELTQNPDWVQYQ